MSEEKVKHSYDESDIQVLEGFKRQFVRDQGCILELHQLEDYIIWYGK